MRRPATAAIGAGFTGSVMLYGMPGVRSVECRVSTLAYQAGSTKTIDLGLFVNGLLVATAELKNALTGQSVEDAIAQYRTDRDPTSPALSRRALVHFAVDTERVAMTTRLAGESTRFLPFNLGDAGGAGNPANPNGHRTAYLWERVWQRDAWLDLLGSFVHKHEGGILFPRFHQWHAVRQLVDATYTDGAGVDRRVQHSAGSGKARGGVVDGQLRAPPVCRARDPHHDHTRNPARPRVRLRRQSRLLPQAPRRQRGAQG